MSSKCKQYRCMCLFRRRLACVLHVGFGCSLCSGQSNMEVRVADVFNATKEIAASGSYPDLRMWTAKNVIAASRQTDVPAMQKGEAGLVGPYAKSVWASSAPAAFPTKANSAPQDAAEHNRQPQQFGNEDWFSACCYFFGRDLYLSQKGSVPIGLMASDWGGQPIQPFMSPDALADTTCGGTHNTTTAARVNGKHSKARSYSENATAGEEALVAAKSDTGSGNSVLWWGMTEPLAQMRMTGAVWYQCVLFLPPRAHLPPFLSLSVSALSARA